MTAGVDSIALRVSPRVRWDDERLAASSGIVPARERYPSQDYAARAWVPRAPFQTTDLASVAANGVHLDRSRIVGLITISPDLLDRMRGDAGGAHSPGSFAPHVEALAAAVRDEWNVTTTPRALSLGRNAAGLTTVTRDPESGQFVGLHIDTFHGNYDAARSLAGNRVSVNIGAGPRWFLFIPLPLRALHARSGVQGPQADVVAGFLHANPQQPVLRLRVDPGEAYIAPTESMIHDAASGTDEDLHVTGRGVLDPRPC